MTMVFASARRRARVEIPNPLARWAFTEQAAPYYSTSADLPLNVAQGAPVRVESPYGGAIDIASGDALRITSADVGRLNIGASGGNQVTVAAWLRRPTDTGTGFIAGCWPENGVRQYGLFVDLAMYGGNNRSCFHVSKTGQATPGYPFSRDYSSDGVQMTTGWQLHVGTYDGTHAISYTDGVATDYLNYTDVQGQTYDKNPYYFPDGLNATPAEFTVGMCITGGTTLGNPFVGQIANIRVWDTALTPAQVAALHDAERV